MNWTISFPSSGNEGRKYLYYTVKFTDQKTQAQKQLCLAEIFESPQFEESFPYTVGFFKELMDEKIDVKCGYLEIRIVRSIEDFWKFLNDLDI